jgi:prevent-host-death family protein
VEVTVLTKTVTIEEARESLPELVEQARQGNEILLTESGKAVARLVSISPAARRRVPGLNRGEIWISDDFDDPLPDEFWAGTS